MTPKVTTLSTLPFNLETMLERQIASDPEWQAGLTWGKPRPGHPEGQVQSHIYEVLNNVDRFYGQSQYRSELRLIALVHDTFKYQSAWFAAAGQQLSHGLLARRFSARYITDDAILLVIELHDEAYKAYKLLEREGDNDAAAHKAHQLVWQLGSFLPLFLQFYHCDSHTRDKDTVHYHWFTILLSSDS